MKRGQAEASCDELVVVPNRVGDTTKTKTQEERMVWLMGDRYNKRQQQLQNAGWKMGFHRSGSLGVDSRHNLRQRMLEEKPGLLYIVGSGGMSDTDEVVSTFLGTLITDQISLCGLI